MVVKRKAQEPLYFSTFALERWIFAALRRRKSDRHLPILGVRHVPFCGGQRLRFVFPVHPLLVLDTDLFTANAGSLGGTRKLRTKETNFAPYGGKYVSLNTLDNWKGNASFISFSDSCIYRRTARYEDYSPRDTRRCPPSLNTACAQNWDKLEILNRHSLFLGNFRQPRSPPLGHLVFSSNSASLEKYSALLKFRLTFVW